MIAPITCSGVSAASAARKRAPADAKAEQVEPALRAVEAIRAAGGEVVGVLALVDREEGGREALEAAGLRVLTLVRASEIVGAMES